MRARGHQVGDGAARVLLGDQALAHQHRIGAGGGVGQQVARAADAGLGDLDDALGDPPGHPAEDPAVHLEGGQVARVDADHGGAGVQGPVEFGLGVHLDQRQQADGDGPLDQRDQRALLQGGHDQQHQVRAVGPGLPELVGADHEVLAQHRHLHRTANRGQVGQRTAEPPLLGQHADNLRAAGFVVRGQRGRIGDGGHLPARRAGPLHFGDHADTLGLKRGQGVPR